jgi:WhiB family transcriptional regulator, redox-sensing transcriptional regulator
MQYFTAESKREGSDPLTARQRLNTVEHVEVGRLEHLMARPMGPESPDLETLLGRPPWMVRGACRGMGTEVFITGRGDSTAAAKATCSTCLVQSECLAFAVANPELVGIWGGTSARERARMRRAVA